MKRMLKDIIKHLKGDQEDYGKEIAEDQKLVRKLRKKKKNMKEVRAGRKAGKRLKQEVAEGKKADKIGVVMDEFKRGKLRSGSKKGPKVKSKKQAMAIALSEAKRNKKKEK